MELFDPRIVDDDYEPYEEAAKIRGYIPEAVIGESFCEISEGLHGEAESARDVIPESAPRTLLDDGRSSDREGAESREQLPEALLHGGRSLDRPEELEMPGTGLHVDREGGQNNNTGPASSVAEEGAEMLQHY